MHQHSTGAKIGLRTKNKCQLYFQVPNFFSVFRKSSSEVFCKKRCSQIFRKIHRKTPVPESLFFLKNKDWYRCFPVHFVKFLIIPFLQNTLGRLLLLFLRYFNSQFLRKQKAANHQQYIQAPVKHLLWSFCWKNSSQLIAGNCFCIKSSSQTLEGFQYAFVLSLTL